MAVVLLAVWLSGIAAELFRKPDPGCIVIDEVAAFPGYALAIDLPRQVVVKPDGSEITFEVQDFRKQCLLNGWDDIGLTLRHADKIRAFEAERLARMPWLDHRPV